MHSQFHTSVFWLWFQQVSRRVATAMPRNKTPVLQLGTIYARGAEFGAHIQFRDDGGNNTNIYGPSRGSQNEAQKDLDQIRAAGRVGSTREALPDLKI